LTLTERAEQVEAFGHAAAQRLQDWDREGGAGPERYRANVQVAALMFGLAARHWSDVAVERSPGPGRDEAIARAADCQAKAEDFKARLTEGRER